MSTASAVPNGCVRKFLYALFELQMPTFRIWPDNGELGLIQPLPGSTRRALGLRLFLVDGENLRIRAQNWAQRSNLR